MNGDVLDVENQRRSLNIYNIEDPHFRKHFRMDKAVFERLIVVVGHQRREMDLLKRERTSVTESTLMGVWMIFNKDTFRTSGLQYDKHPSVAHYHYKLLLEVLCSIGHRYIKWPNPRQRQQTSIYFERNFGFPGAVGLIDGTLIKITAPAEQRQRYVDKNGKYSLNVMIVSNQHRLILDTYIGQPGSVHDGRVFRRSPLAKCLYGRNDVLGPDEHLIGDGGYVLTNKMMIPYRDDGHLTPSHRNFNRVLSQCRATVERLNSLLKSRMARLQMLFCKSMETTVSHIASASVLHNFILLHGEEAEGIVFEGDVPEVDVVEAMQADQPAGYEKRRFIREFLERDQDEEE